MLQNFIDSINAVLPIFLLVVLGYVLKRMKFGSDKFYEDAEKFVFVIALPCQLFISVAFGSSDAGNVDYGGTLLFCVCGVTLAFILALTAVPLFIKNNGIRGAVIQNCFRSNFAILGIPLAENIAGAAGKTAISIVMPFAIILYNVYSVIELNIFAPREIRKTPKQLFLTTLKSIATNPLIISVVLGLPFMLTGWTFPSEFRFIDTTIGYLSDTTQALILIALGAGFSFSSLRGKLRYSLLTSIYKTVVLPVAAVLCAHYLFGFSGIPLVIVFILFGTPSAVSSYIMAKNMKSDYEIAGQTLLMSTLMCIFTLFAGVFVLKTLGWVGA